MVGDRIDLDHEAAAAYVAACRDGDGPKPKPARAPTPKPKPAQKPPRKPTGSSDPPEFEVAAPTEHRRAPHVDRETGYCDELADWTLAEIVEQFGTIRSFKDILEAHEKRERARKNRLDNEQTEGNLIERERVRTHVLGFIEASHKRILSDAAKTVAKRAMGLVKAGASVEELEKFVRDTLGSILRPARDAATRNLRRKKPKKPPPEDE